MEINKVYQGHTLDILQSFPDESVDCVITSPPYWGLRDYGDETKVVWGGNSNCNHEFGDELLVKISGGLKSKKLHCKNKDNFQSFQNTMQFCFHCNALFGQLGHEPTFDLYLDHLIDVFREIKRVMKKTGTCWVNIGDSYIGSGKGIVNIPNKSLCLIPFRFAMRMVDELGFILRNTIIWHKPNAMPSSAKDRFTVDFEYVFFFVKDKKYYFEQQIEKYDKPLDRWGGNILKPNGTSLWSQETGQNLYRLRDMRPNPSGRNMRTTWTISTKSFHDAHFAVFPETLIERIIKAGCPEGGVVLDPFIGSGTTATVAKKLNRDWIGIEINPLYVKMAEKRIKKIIVQDKIQLISGDN